MAVYPFQKLVLAAKLAAELEAALGGGVVEYVNTSAGPPATGEVHTSRNLTAQEFTLAVGVIQAHDASTGEGIGATYKQLRAVAAPLIGTAFTSLTLAQLRIVLACVCVKLGFVGPDGLVQLPDAE